jgi:uncharacterized iron-regulated membrane protein
MFPSFRLSMAWVHTWFGLVLGLVLMSMFFFGALSVFDREIDRWTVPSTRFAPQPMPSFDKMLEPIFRQITPEEDELEEARARIGSPQLGPLPLQNWSAYTTHRDPVLALYAEFAVDNPNDPGDHVHGYVTIDPRNGRFLPAEDLNVGTDFFYPMHFSLHLTWKDLGYWIVGLAALVMLAALVSGIIIHRKIFREFFTFRPKKQTQRSALDLHNLTGVVALPFHFMFALSGLIIFAGIYFPVDETMLKPLADAHEEAEAARTGLPLKPAGVPARLASVDAMVAEAQRRWNARGMAGEVGYLFINHIDDINATVSIYRAGTDRIATASEGVHFNGVTGQVIREDPPVTAVGGISDFITGLHLQHFRHWLLRWLYFMGGLAGCVCIATGFIFFVEKRKRQHAERGSSGARWADALAVTAVTGMLVATLALLVSNRLLPAELAQRGDWEQRIFWMTWLVVFAHAWWRSAPVLQARIAPAWAEQCWAIAALAVLAVLMNWITTGDHLLRTIGNGYWPVAGIDLTLLASAALAVLAAVRLRRRARSAQISTSDFIPGRDDAVLPEADHA